MERKQGFVLSDLTPANDFSFLNSYEKNLGKCCIDRLRPPGFSVTGE